MSVDGSYLIDPSSAPPIQYDLGQGGTLSDAISNGLASAVGPLPDYNLNYIMPSGTAPTSNSSWYNSPMGAAGLNALAQLGLGLFGANANRQAAGAQQQVSQQALAQQLGMFNTMQRNLQPYMLGGSAAFGKLQSLLGLGGVGSASIQKALNSLPGYQYTLNTGLQQVQNSAAARGLGSSGAALRGASDYATAEAQQNYMNYANQLMNASSLGESAAAGAGAVGAQYGQNLVPSYSSLGSAQAAGYLAPYNALASGVQSAGNGLLGAAYANMYAPYMANNALLAAQQGQV